MKLDFFSAAPRPANEAERQAEVERVPEAALADPRLGEILEEVRALLGTPMATLSIIDGDVQRFVARRGLDIAETPRATAICAHSLDGDRQVRTYADLNADKRFRFNPLVQGAPHLRSYVGAPVVTASGFALGVLCGLDPRPRNPTGAAAEARLRALSDRVAAILAEYASTR